MDIIEMNNAPSRIIYLSGDVEDTSIADVCKQILSINEFDNAMMYKYRQYNIQPIQLHIQSFGGSIHDMWALIDTIEASDTPVATFCSGYCMSAASLIFLAGHYRYMYKHSSMMFHQMSVGTWGKINDFRLEQSHFDAMHKDIIKYIKRHTKLDKKFFKRFDKNKEDVYLTAKKCLKYGVCDCIVDTTDNRELMQNIMKQQEAQNQECLCADDLNNLIGG